MPPDTLYRSQCVRLAAGARKAVAPHVGVRAADIDELLVDLVDWPDEVWASPRPACDGRSIAGDPVLLDATDAGLILEAAGETRAVLVPWRQVRGPEALPSRVPSGCQPAGT